MSDELVPSTHVERAAWYTAGIGGRFGTVGSVIPRGFDRYARVLHPARAPDGSAVPWAQVAAEMGTVMHPQAQFGSVARRRFPDQDHPVGWPGENPDEGSLPRAELQVLCRLLGGFTTTPDRCWLTVWEGWGSLPRHWQHTLPRIHQPHRAYFVFERRLADVVAFSADINQVRPESQAVSVLAFEAPAATDVQTADACPAPLWLQSPSQWWPDDRAWCVATEIDFDSTLVAGSAALLDTLLAEPTLEVVEVQADDDLTWAGDTVNPPP